MPWPRLHCRSAGFHVHSGFPLNAADFSFGSGSFLASHVSARRPFAFNNPLKVYEFFIRSTDASRQCFIPANVVDFPHKRKHIPAKADSGLKMEDSAEFQRWKVTEPYLNIHCELGEAPYYEVAANKLRFVDIKKHRLHMVELSVGPSSLKTLQLDIPVGVTADIEGVDLQKKILVGGKTGLAVLYMETGKYKYLTRFYDSTEGDDRMRSNDGTVDSEGRFWIGTMNDFHVGEPQAEGTLFRIDSDLSRHAMKHPVTIPNGIGWMPDNQTLLFTHSTEKTIFAYDFSPATGDISNQRVFYHHDGPGDPDGWKMDCDGFVWQCVYGEGKVLKISPEGNLVGEVSVPTRNVTCPCFVGEELWITSAVEDEPEKHPESAKHGGALFRVNVGVTGIKEYKFRLNKDVRC